MKILITNWRDIKHPLAGGAEISTHEHAKGWVHAGHDVILFSSSFTGSKSSEIIDGITIIRRGNHYTVHLYALVYYLMTLKGKIDLLVDEFHFIPFFTPLYAGEKKLAFIHETAEEIWFKNKPWPISALGYFLEPFFFKLYRNIHFMTVSESTKRDLIKFGVKEKNISIVYNGIKLSGTPFTRKETTPTIIYLGKLAKDKGVEDAFTAFYHVQEKLKKAKFWVVGKEENGGYKSMLKQLADKLKITNKTEFFDYVSEQKKFELLKRARVLIHPSIKEGWGLTVIEAASQGTPTVAYNTSGLQDSIKNNRTGLLVDGQRPTDLADKIVALCTQQSLYKRLSENAKIWSKNFTWEKSIKISLDIIEHLL